MYFAPPIFDIMSKNMEQLYYDITWYVERGYGEDCRRACRYAQIRTARFIETLHPATAFRDKKTGEGKSLILSVRKNKRYAHQIQIGAFKVTGTMIQTNLFANHFARWYNTGAFGRKIKSGERAGQKGPTYDPHTNSDGSVFEKNARFINQYFKYQVEWYFKNVAKIIKG